MEKTRLTDQPINPLCFSVCLSVGTTFLRKQQAPVPSLAWCRIRAGAAAPNFVFRFLALITRIWCLARMIVLEGNGKVTAEITTQAEAACTRQDCIAQYCISASAGS